MHDAAEPQTEPDKWWYDATGYQIYPRSFCDSNGDGIGDIPGITSKLDHLRDLGVGFIWLSPIYASPMADNGYDIADYRAIAPEYGTLQDFDSLVDQAKARGIGIVMDLVVNHSSAAHEWFQAARASTANPAHEYYIWRDPAPDGGPPSAHRACFGGSAWHFVPEIGKYYLGYFSAEQPDLNWRNQRLRREIYDMMNWWLDRGIAGFRMDVISLIGKDVDAGIFEEGPFLHEYLQEMHRETLAGRDVVTVGESWAVSRNTALLYCGRERRELDMVFQFNHIVEGWDPVHGKWKPRAFDLVAFKRVLNDWQETLSEDGWNSLFLSNHDLPRQVSRYGDDGRYRVQSAKMLATVIHLMKGTPFVYQGEEIGMTNVRFSRIDQFRDIETLGNYADAIADGVEPADFIAGANTNGRDNARTPMQWSADAQAGFTSGTPWIEVNSNHTEINVEMDRTDPEGIFEYYRRLISLRKSMSLVVHGRYKPFAVDDPSVFAFARELEEDKLSVIANFTANPIDFDVPEELACSGTCLLSNYAPRDCISGIVRLNPYEIIVVSN